MPGKSIYCVDSDILISVLKNEALPVGVREAIDELLESAENGKLIVITSTVTLVEVMDGRMTDEAREMFTSYFDRKTIVMVDADIKIMRLAGKIRDHHSQEIPTRKIQTPDAIHMATAMRYKAEAFYTFDEKLLKLNGKVLGDSLTIETPIKEQLSLDGQDSLFALPTEEASIPTTDTQALEATGGSLPHGQEQSNSSVDSGGQIVQTIPQEEATSDALPIPTKKKK